MTTDDQRRTFEVPVLLNVTVTVDPDGSTHLAAAYPDCEAAPWAYSSDPAAWEPDGPDPMGGYGVWHEGTREGAPFAAWCAAYDKLPAIPAPPEPIRWHDRPVLVLDYYEPEALAAAAAPLGVACTYNVPGPGLVTVTGPLPAVRELLARQWDAALVVDERGAWDVVGR